MTRPGLSDAAIRSAICAMAEARAPKTLCPSEVSRHLSEDWRALMPDVRRVAGGLAKDGRIVVTQKGAAVDIDTATGPVRLGYAQN